MNIQNNDNLIPVITTALKVSPDQITNISSLKKGMTNDSFLFDCMGKRYIIRIPGAGTDKLISRKQEYEVYQKIAPLKISDNIAYFDPINGYKITEYLENARVCNPGNKSDVKICMRKLRNFHEKNLQVPHSFDIFRQIEFYEALWNGKKSCYSDYQYTKAGIFELKEFITHQKKHWTLAHIDAVPDNFLFVPHGNGQDIRLIDWEYAGMQDACVDIAMFAIYAMYNRKEIEYLIQAYYPEGCPETTRLKLYCYIACCGLLWSNWCEYKRQLGIEFGEYSFKQYNYAKEYYDIFQQEHKIQNRNGEPSNEYAICR